VFSERGYAATSEAEIALRADVSWAVFDECFRHKDEVLYEIATEANGELVRRVVGTLGLNPRVLGAPDGMADSAKHRLRALVEAFLETREVEGSLRTLMQARRRHDDALDALCCTTERTLINLIARLLDLLQRPGDRVALAMVLYGLVEGAIRVHGQRERLISDERFVDGVVTAVLNIVFPGRTAH
jgi:AcrR family transcriptional regulator